MDTDRTGLDWTGLDWTGLDCGQWTVDSGQWTVDSGQWTVDSGLVKNEYLGFLNKILYI